MSRRLPVALAFALLAFALAAQVAACGGAASDPFAGSWWEPSSGRRVQIEAAADGYQVLIGADLQSYPATETGGELRVAHPELGSVVIRQASGGRLELVEGDTTGLLERAPQHQ